MSDLRSVLAFFIGLVVFVLLVAFAVGKLIAPKKTASTKIVATVTATPAPVQTVTPTPKSSTTLFGRIFGVFSKKPTATPTPKQAAPSPTPLIVAVNTNSAMPTLKPALNPDGSVKPVIYVKNNVQNVTTIPETGAETMFLPLSMLLGGAGMWFKRKK